MTSHLNTTGDQLNQMDNRAYETDAKGHVELGAVVTSDCHGTQTSPPASCSDTCFGMHHAQQQLLQSGKQTESPWHPLKTRFLIGAVVCLFIWAIVYALLNHFTEL